MRDQSSDSQISTSQDISSGFSGNYFTTQYLYKYRIDDEKTLIVNTLSGAADVVDTGFAAILIPRARVDRSALQAAEWQFLAERSYLVQDEVEKAAVQQWFRNFERGLRSVHFIVCPTLTCNLRCHYCYEPLGNRASPTSMTPAHVDSMFIAMDRQVEERQAKDVHLEFFGGEPFLRSNLAIVQTIVAKAAERGWGISGITNGTQVDAYLPLFREYAPWLTQMQVTLDGPQDLHDQIRVNARGRGSYAEIVRNVSSLLDLRIPVVVRINTGIDTVAALGSLLDDFEDRGWTSHDHFQCQLAPINDHGCTGRVANYQPEFKLLAQLHAVFADWEATRARYHLSLGYDMERRTSLFRRVMFDRQSPAVRTHDLSGCSASNGHYIVFGADGLLYACPETVGLASAAVGRFFPDFAVDEQKWDRWKVNISNTTKCRDCNIAPLCGGACPWHGFNASEEDAYRPHCNYAQQTIKAYLDLNRSRLLELVA